MPLPKYRLVADALLQDIQDGRHTLGSLLPSEHTIGTRFGVSRHTVRLALKTLSEWGVAESQQGVGTTVIALRTDHRYTQAFETAQDLLQYARASQVRVLAQDEVVVDAALADVLKCHAGEHWRRLVTLRSDEATAAVIALSEIYVPLAFAAVMRQPLSGAEPLFSRIERQFNEPIVEIQQEIGCAPALTASEARHLGLPGPAAGMEIIRRYYGRNRRLLEVSRTVHPAGLFRYSMVLRQTRAVDS